MSKIGLAVGEDFPLQDLSGPPNSTEEKQAEADCASQTGCGENQEGPSEEQSEFARWKWRREGQRLWDEDVRNQRADWEAKKRAFKEKIRATVRDAVRANVNRNPHVRVYWWRSIWPSVAGIGLAALALAIHRRSHHQHPGGCRYYDDADVETPPRPTHKSPPSDSGEPIVTPPPPRGH